MLPLRPREEVMRVQSIFVAAERWQWVLVGGWGIEVGEGRERDVDVLPLPL